jgi:Ca2+-binding RTX toxin-like protein
MATYNGTGAGDTYVGPWGEANVILGAGGNDTLTGGALPDSIDGGVGDDVLNGRFGSDFLLGGDGNDSLIGGEGDDEIVDGKGNDTVDAGSGDDLVDLTSALGPEINLVRLGSGDDLVIGGKSRDTIDGGTGVDVVSYATANAAVDFSLYLGKGSAGWAENDTYVQIEHAIGSEFSDKIDGDSRVNIVDGLSGADKIKGKGGDDILVGGYGQDTIFGGRGADQMDGGAGIDTLSYVGSAYVAIDLLSESFTNADAEGDSAINFEIIQLGDQGGIVYGDNGDNHFIGGAGNDTLDGRLGNDSLDGGGSSDNFYGGPGNDTLTMGSAVEAFIAQDSIQYLESLEGAGAQTDTITDFDSLNDKINFSYTTAPDFSNWTETMIDADGDSNADDLQVVTDVNITIILLDVDASNFDITDTFGVVP